MHALDRHNTDINIVIDIDIESETDKNMQALTGTHT